MITKLEYKANKKTIIRVTTDKGHFNIYYSDIRPYWFHSKPSGFEGGRAYGIGDYVLFTMLTGSRQGGVVCVWDCNQNKLVHISNGDYCSAATIYEDKVLTLCDIYNYRVRERLEVYSYTFGTMDAWGEGTQIISDHYKQLTALPGEEEDIRIEDNKMIITIGKEDIVFHSDVASVL